MIDVRLLVYAGTLAVFVICTPAVGVLSVVVFTSLAAVAGIARARRNQQTRQGHANSFCPDPVEDQAASEEGEIRALAADEIPWTEHERALDPVRGWRRAQPRMIQHT